MPTERTTEAIDLINETFGTLANTDSVLYEKQEPAVTAHNDIVPGVYVPGITENATSDNFYAKAEPDNDALVTGEIGYSGMILEAIEAYDEQITTYLDAAKTFAGEGAYVEQQWLKENPNQYLTEDQRNTIAVFTIPRKYKEEIVHDLVERTASILEKADQLYKEGLSGLYSLIENEHFRDASDINPTVSEQLPAKDEDELCKAVRTMDTDEAEKLLEAIDNEMEQSGTRITIA